MNTRTNLRQAVHALSDALDLVGIDDIAHGKRVGIMAAACAVQMGLDSKRQALLFDLGLLHDIGVSSTSTHRHLVEEFDWDQAGEHCRCGYDLLRDFGPLAHMADSILYHHTRWDELQSLDLPDEDRLQANLILLVDRADALAAPYHARHNILAGRREIRDRLAASRETYFSPELVDVFLDASGPEAFWLHLDVSAIGQAMRDQESLVPPTYINMEETCALAHIFGRIVDAKSPFTAEHSLGVARVARRLGVLMGVEAIHCVGLEIAGLLHDLGKLRVPDDILNKPSGLTPDEWDIISAHSFETYQILRRIEGFEDIALWAAHHHESPDGSGYPFHADGFSLPLEARIIRVADIFQAMVQDRPYRPGLTQGKVQAFMRTMARQNRIDQDVAAVLDLHVQDLMSLARHPAILSN